jgi:hypothetical protein
MNIVRMQHTGYSGSPVPSALSPWWGVFWGGGSFVGFMPLLCCVFCFLLVFCCFIPIRYKRNKTFQKIIRSEFLEAEQLLFLLC